MRRLAVALATVAGLGRVPWAPGTWGSLVGLGIGWAARGLSGPWLAMLGGLAFLAAVAACTVAERELSRVDPPAIILDEVWGMAAVAAALPSLDVARDGTLSGVEWVPPSARSWELLLAAFFLFRVFDIVKPPPLKRLARLPAGWGVMADDAGAALYTLVTLGLALWLSA
jgi:phosphatidylglycerophosphatase A